MAETRIPTDTPAARAQLALHVRSSKTLAFILQGLLLADDNVPDGIDENDPEGRTQRMFVVLETLQGRFDAMQLITEGRHE